MALGVRVGRLQVDERAQLVERGVTIVRWFVGAKAKEERAKIPVEGFLARARQVAHHARATMSRPAVADGGVVVVMPERSHARPLTHALLAARQAS